MRLQIISDLHIDINKICKNKFPKLIKPMCDNLAILGDSTNNYNNGNFKDLIDYCCKNFKKVLFLTGNHEYYGNHKETVRPTMAQVDEHYRGISIKHINFHYLQRDVIKIDGIKILGCTLWSHIPKDKMTPVQKYMMDYHLITTDKGLFTPQENNELHTQDLNWLKQELKEKVPTVILTHHSPVLDSGAPKYNGRVTSCAFETDLEYIIKENEHLKLWAFGHTHFPFYKKVNDCIVFSNPKGYGDENNAYAGNHFIDLS